MWEGINSLTLILLSLISALGKVELKNLSTEERRDLKSNISSYLEILDRRNLIKEETKFLRYIKDLIVLDEKSNN